MTSSGHSGIGGRAYGQLPSVQIEALALQSMRRLDDHVVAMTATVQKPLLEFTRSINKLQNAINEPVARAMKQFTQIAEAMARISVPKVDRRQLAQVIKYLKARSRPARPGRNLRRRQRVEAALARLGLKALAWIAPAEVAAALRRLLRQASLGPPGNRTSARRLIQIRVPAHEATTEIMRHGPPAGLAHPSPAVASACS